MTETTEPILASERISDVLKKHPALLETLIDLSPAFRNLRNPMLRRVQTRLVTVSQAAGIAGMEPAFLTQRLNEAAGISAPRRPQPAAHAGEIVGAVADPAIDGAPVAAEIDVRPLMARGEEPFKAIMTAAQTVPAGSTLRLIAGFEPLPLYDVLAKQGFVHRAHQVEADAWEVRFYRERSGSDAETVAAATATSGPVDWADVPSTEITIDVSELVPPEPMIRILEALEKLPPEGRLLVHHVRRPIHLYERLDEMGYRHDTRELGPGRIEVLIQKQPA
jgi:uncharacterized protein (DUF2249 family)